MGETNSNMSSTLKSGENLSLVLFPWKGQAFSWDGHIPPNATQHEALLEYIH